MQIEDDQESGIFSVSPTAASRKKKKKKRRKVGELAVTEVAQPSAVPSSQEAGWFQHFLCSHQSKLPTLLSAWLPEG